MHPWGQQQQQQEMVGDRGLVVQGLGQAMLLALRGPMCKWGCCS